MYFVFFWKIYVLNYKSNSNSRSQLFLFISWNIDEHNVNAVKGTAHSTLLKFCNEIGQNLKYVNSFLGSELITAWKSHHTHTRSCLLFLLTQARKFNFRFLTLWAEKRQFWPLLKKWIHMAVTHLVILMSLVSADRRPSRLTMKTNSSPWFSILCLRNMAWCFLYRYLRTR